jgi:hypothetical protein
MLNDAYATYYTPSSTLLCIKLLCALQSDSSIKHTHTSIGSLQYCSTKPTPI